MGGDPDGYNLNVTFMKTGSAIRGRACTYARPDGRLFGTDTSRFENSFLGTCVKLEHEAAFMFVVVTFQKLGLEVDLILVVFGPSMVQSLALKVCSFKGLAVDSMETIVGGIITVRAIGWVPPLRSDRALSQNSLGPLKSGGVEPYPFFFVQSISGIVHGPRVLKGQPKARSY
eukprot:12403413-Heterocapsa_arctica.AAC.1